MPPTLSIIIVSYNTWGLLKKCLQSIFNNISFSKEIILVDNNSYDNSSLNVAKCFPKVKVIKNKINLGYNAANNQGLKIAKGDYILLLNPDTQVTKESVDQLIEYLDEHRDVAIVGPKIIDLNGKPTLSAYPLPNFLDAAEEGSLTYLLPFNPFLDKLVYRRKYALDIFSNEPLEVGWVSGAALMIRRSVFDNIGLKDENLYAYAEEADWSIKARKKGYKTIYFPQAQIVHVGSASSKQNWTLVCNRVRSAYFERVYFAKKYFSPVSLYFLKLFLFFEIVGKIILRYFFTWEEPKRSEYLKAYYKALKYLH